MQAIETEGLAKTVGTDRRLFSGLSIGVSSGELVAITGESGVGKSTLLNMLAGLDDADAGEVRIEGVALGPLDDAARTKLRRERIGFVFQAFHILPYLTLEQNVALPLALISADGAIAKTRAGEMLAEVDGQRLLTDAFTTALGYKAPPGLVGIHLNMVMFQPTDEERANATPAEQRMLDDAQRYDQQYSGYYKLQGSRPQSVAFSLADSPVGLAAWSYALFEDVSDSDGDPESAFTLDAMIDDIMLYWLTNTGPSSARLYWEGMQEMMKGGMPAMPMRTATGISMFPGEQIRLSRRWAERRFGSLVHFNELDRGGHFAALDQPQAFAEEVRTTFRSIGQRG